MRPASSIPGLNIESRNCMKLFATFLSVPVVFVCGALSLTTDSAHERIRSLAEPLPLQLAAVPAPPPPPLQLNDVVRIIARKHGVKQNVVKSIIAVESAFDQDAVSPRGAIGLMQLTPATARECGIDPSIAELNIEGGTYYFSRLLIRYRKARRPVECALAAYNAGPRVVDKYHGVPPFRETRKYVRRVLSLSRQLDQRTAPPVSRIRRLRQG